MESEFLEDRQPMLGQPGLGQPTLGQSTLGQPTLGQPGLGVESTQWLVVCLCAQWCGVCKQYRQGFEDLAARHPEGRFVWLDIEDQEEVAGDLDIETFPSLLICDAQHARFLGPLLPQLPVLARLLQSLQATGPERAAVSASAQALRDRVLAAGLA